MSGLATMDSVGLTPLPPVELAKISFDRHTRVASADEPSWFRSCRRTIRRLGELPHDWDGNGSAPPSNEACALGSGLLQSIRLLGIPAPHISPVSGGGLQLEWQVDGRELEIEIDSSASQFWILEVREDLQMDELQSRVEQQGFREALSAVERLLRG